MKSEISLVGYIDKESNKINLLEYYFNPDFIPEEFFYNDLHLKLTLFSEKRSKSQNNLLWGYAYPVIISFLKELDGVERTKDEIHIFNMVEIQKLEYKKTEIYGKEVYVLERGHSSDWSKKEFSEAYEKLQNFWAEKGCIIPDRDILKEVADPVEILTDKSRMVFGPYKNQPLGTVPDEYLLELYENKKRYCPESLKNYIRIAFDM